MSETKEQPNVERKPGVCLPWEERKAELPPIESDEPLVQRIWEEVDEFGYMYIWQVLLSF
ncbi:MAG: hypothetical protein D6741_15605 [Planctomycetota bacterium]|nr:MAG: hypothetical protein D6741_15605 [Planctomycetota bacterium]